MPPSTIATKIFIPSNQREIVSRQRLVEQLNAGFHRKLTLISAPAGFGKTTLISEWVNNIKLDPKKENQTAACSRPVDRTSCRRLAIYKL